MKHTAGRPRAVSEEEPRAPGLSLQPVPHVRQGEETMYVRNVLRQSLVTSAVTAIMLGVASAAFAFEAPVQPLAERVKAADAVVLATVRNVEYRLSTPTAAQAPIPFTFVTFDVESVIRGQAARDKLTLRFHGGLFPDGRFLEDPTAPLFDVGERSILLVSRNGELDVPLAGWRFGRLRVIAGRVYDDFGKPVAIVNSERVKFGKTVRFDEVVQHKIGPNRSFNPRVRELPPVGAAVADEPGPGEGRTETQSGTEAATLEAILGWIRAIPSQATTKSASNQDPNTPFVARSLRAVAPRRVR